MLHRTSFWNHFFVHQNHAPPKLDFPDTLFESPFLAARFRSWQNPSWRCICAYLVGGFNPFETYTRQIGSFPQVGMNIKNIWNHHPDIQCLKTAVNYTIGSIINGLSMYLVYVHSRKLMAGTWEFWNLQKEYHLPTGAVFRCNMLLCGGVCILANYYNSQTWIQEDFGGDSPTITTFWGWGHSAGKVPIICHDVW